MVSAGRYIGGERYTSDFLIAPQPARETGSVGAFETEGDAFRFALPPRR
jgi:hypothetical protein